MTDLEERLRAELRHHAERAPGAAPLAEQIIAAARTQPRPLGRRGWPTWSMPLLAAGAVAAIVTGVFVGVAQIKHSADPGVPGIGTHAPTLTNPAPTPLTSTAAPSPSTSVPVVPPPNRSTPPNTSHSPTSTELAGVQLLDVTFASEDHGVALASADCVSGPGTCTALLRTTDGTTWQSMPGARFNVPGVNGCADPCVTHLRYATDDIGYAFGPSAFYVTTDGGRDWARQPGGATELETLNGYVLRVRTDGASCPACGLLQRSSVRGTSFIARDAPTQRVINRLWTRVKTGR